MSNWIQRAFRHYLNGPDHFAKLRIVRFLKPWILPERGLLCSVDSDVKLWLNPEDDIEGKLFQGQGYEKATLGFIRTNLRAGGCAVLAGANTGLHMVVAARVAGKGGIVVGVEPQPWSIHRAMQNLKANTFDATVYLVCAGLGAKSTLMPMGEAPPTHTGWGSLVLRDPGNTPYQVSIFTYDQLLLDLKLKLVDLMILDVEGFELQVLKGMSPDRSPAILIMEIHKTVLQLLSQSEANYYEALWGLGYETWSLSGSIAKPGDELIDNNIVCVKRNCAMPTWIQLNSIV